MLVVGSVLELASDAIGAVPVQLVLPAHFGFVVDWEIAFHHYLVLAVREAASVTELAVAGLLEVLAHFCSELVDVWGADEVGWIS